MTLFPWSWLVMMPCSVGGNLEILNFTLVAFFFTWERHLLTQTKKSKTCNNGEEVKVATFVT